jgi:putative GTP pyrophosphokinase
MSEMGKNELEEIELIIEDYSKNLDKYKNYGEYLLKEINGVRNVHALHYRVKDPEYLRRKIIRKNKIGRNINLLNYRDEITDLLGLRVLHIFKDEWQNIDKFIRKKFNLHEHPKAYIRDGDIKKSIFNQHEFHVEVHKFGYRSLHYIFKENNLDFPIVGEIQVRTIFEEAWSEMDHRVRYPDHSDIGVLTEYSLVLNRLSGLGDEMGMNIKNLKIEFNERDSELQEYINKLKIADTEKQELQQKIMNRNAVIGLGATFGIINSIKQNDYE